MPTSFEDSFAYAPGDLNGDGPWPWSSDSFSNPTLEVFAAGQVGASTTDGNIYSSTAPLPFWDTAAPWTMEMTINIPVGYGDSAQIQMAPVDTAGALVGISTNIGTPSTDFISLDVPGHTTVAACTFGIPHVITSIWNGTTIVVKLDGVTKITHAQSQATFTDPGWNQIASMIGTPGVYVSHIKLTIP